MRNNSPSEYYSVSSRFASPFVFGEKSP